MSLTVRIVKGGRRGFRQFSHTGSEEVDLAEPMGECCGQTTLTCRSNEDKGKHTIEMRVHLYGGNGLRCHITSLAHDQLVAHVNMRGHDSRNCYDQQEQDQGVGGDGVRPQSLWAGRSCGNDVFSCSRVRSWATMAGWKQALFTDRMRGEVVMKQVQLLTALAVSAALGTFTQSQGLAQAWQGNAITHFNGTATLASKESQQDRTFLAQRGWSEREAVIHKVGSDAYSGGYPGMSGADMKSGAAASSQAPTGGDRYRQTGDYKFSSPSNDSRYGANPSDNYFRKESSGASGATNSPYGGAVYGGVPSTPSADPMIKELNRDPSMR